MTQHNDPFVIVSVVRTLIGHFGGVFKKFSTTELGSAAIKATMERVQIKPEDIEIVVLLEERLQLLGWK